MILVDTSVWIDFFSGNDTPAVTKFSGLLAKGLPFGLTSVIYQELRQGSAK